MLLGIALHAALAYQAVGTGWPIADSETSPFFDQLVAFTHGFRMPLFFVLGGSDVVQRCCDRNAASLGC